MEFCRVWKSHRFCLPVIIKTLKNTVAMYFKRKLSNNMYGVCVCMCVCVCVFVVWCVCETKIILYIVLFMPNAYTYGYM